MKSICWASDNPDQLDSGFMSSVKADAMLNDCASWFLQQKKVTDGWQYWRQPVSQFIRY
jgi:hypothetical protein